MLTEEHRSKRMAALLENLYCYQNEEESFMESIKMKLGFMISPQS
jgi:hypothetical protein